MSVLGTGIAAAVSQTGLQAQQVARESDRKKAQDDESARRVRKRFEAHLHSLEDLDQIEPVDQIRVDGHPLPQDQSENAQTHGEPANRDSDADQPIHQDVSEPTLTSNQPSDSDGQLYHHLDVKG